MALDKNAGNHVVIFFFCSVLSGLEQGTATVDKPGVLRTPYGRKLQKPAPPLVGGAEESIF